MTDAQKQTVTIKKYANRRLYNTATSSYVTLGDLSAMVKEGIEFNVYDAKTSEDITRSVLTQIIVEEEGKAGHQNLLPISFLRQLIGFYGDNMQWLVPKYLEHSMQSLSKNQEQIRGYFQSAFGGMFPFGSTLEQMGKQNIAMFERAMRMFAPFGATAENVANMASGAMNDAVEENEKAASRMSEATSKGSEKASEKAAERVQETFKSSSAPSNVTPMPSPAPLSMPISMPTPATTQASMPPAGEEVQSKIAALQRQLADLAKNKA